MKAWIILLIILGVGIAVMVYLYFRGKKMQKQQDEQREQIEQSKQVISMLVIDKKKLRLRDSGLPSYVIEKSSWLQRRMKVPVVKARANGRIMTFIADKEVFEMMPLKKEVKATVSGLYIIGVKALRGSLELTKKQKKVVKKQGSKIDQLLRKGRGEM